MAFFGVTIEKIERIDRHPDPEVERLELAKCEGMSFQFVVQKGTYQDGSLVLYFPLDSIIPDALIAKMDMVGKFGGPNKNVVKTMRIRGQISQGFVVPAAEFLPTELWAASPEEITEYLGVTKFVVEPLELKTAIGIGLPSGYSVYDIEGADRNQEIVDILMDQNVVILEKMEGENSSFGKVNDQNYVSCRERSLVEKPGVENAFWKVVRENNLLEMMKKYPADSVMCYGEMCGPGIMGNHYQLKNKTVFIFDIRATDWVDFLAVKSFLEEHSKIALTAPVIFMGKLRDFLTVHSDIEVDGMGSVPTERTMTIQEASNGTSLVNPKVLREGIVIKPLIEQTHPKIGRLIIKQRSPQYLAKTGR